MMIGWQNYKKNNFENFSLVTVKQQEGAGEARVSKVVVPSLWDVTYLV